MHIDDAIDYFKEACSAYCDASLWGQDSERMGRAHSVLSLTK